MGTICYIHYVTMQIASMRREDNVETPKANKDPAFEPTAHTYSSSRTGVIRHCVPFFTVTCGSVILQRLKFGLV